jgi:hypothetical protein
MEPMKPSLQGSTESLNLATHGLTLWQILGPDSPAAVQSAGLPMPDVMQAAALADGFVARTGREEFLIATAIPPRADDGASCWCYARDDRVLALTGTGWRRVMAQICHLDLRGFGAGDWQMAAAAGVNVWCLGLEDGLLLGCDPSLGHYLQQTLAAVVNDLNSSAQRAA